MTSQCPTTAKHRSQKRRATPKFHKSVKVQNTMSVAPDSIRATTEAVRRFVEDFASALTEEGVPRMPARSSFVALLLRLSRTLGGSPRPELADGCAQARTAMSGAPLPDPDRDGPPGGTETRLPAATTLPGPPMSLGRSSAPSATSAMPGWTEVLRGRGSGLGGAGGRIPRPGPGLPSSAGIRVLSAQKSWPLVRSTRLAASGKAGHGQARPPEPLTGGTGRRDDDFLARLGSTVTDIGIRLVSRTTR